MNADRGNQSLKARPSIGKDMPMIGSREELGVKSNTTERQGMNGTALRIDIGTKFLVLCLAALLVILYLLRTLAAC